MIAIVFWLRAKLCLEMPIPLSGKLLGLFSQPAGGKKREIKMLGMGSNLRWNDDPRRSVELFELSIKERDFRSDFVACVFPPALGSA
jgi:hypothetical protein